MIVFVLYLHVCTTQLTSMRGGAPARLVTACSQQQRGAPYTTQAKCDAAGKAALGPLLADDAADRKVDAYQCTPQTLN